MKVTNEVHAVGQMLTHALCRAGAHHGLRLRQVQRGGFRQGVGQRQRAASVQHHKLKHQNTFCSLCNGLCAASVQHHKLKHQNTSQFLYSLCNGLCAQSTSEGI